jgi:hypothetical protein
MKRQAEVHAFPKQPRQIVTQYQSNEIYDPLKRQVFQPSKDSGNHFHKAKVMISTPS